MEGREAGLYAFNEGLRYADELAVVSTETNGRLIRFANNEPAIVESFNLVALELLLKRAGRILQSSLEVTSRRDIQNHLKILAKKASLLPQFKDYAELPQGPFRYKKIKGIFDPKILDAKKSFKLIEQGINSALSEGAERVCGSLKSNMSRIYLFTSKGVETCHQGTSAVLELRALGKEVAGELLQKGKLKGRISEASGAATTCGTRLDDLKPKEAGEEAGRLATLSENPGKGREGRYDVVFGRAAAAVIFERLGMEFSAFLVDAGISCITDKIGQTIAAENVTICDDGTIEGGIKSVPFDAEGCPTQRNQLIYGGKAKNYLHNSITAKKFGSRLTGNAGWAVPHPHNIFVEPSDWKEEELIAEVRKGLYVANLGYLRFQDERKGDFSAVLRDGIFLIKDGEIRRPLIGLRLNSNLLQFLKNIFALSRRSVQTLHWWMEARIPVFTPAILVRDLRFTLPTI